MFTGLITDVGEVIERSGGQFTLRTTYALRPEDAGAVDLLRRRVSDRDDDQTDVGTARTLPSTFPTRRSARRRSRAGRPDGRVNLERSLRAGDELGGHIVSGHVDGVAKIFAITPDGASKRFLFEAPEHLSRYIAPKGSVALNGTSLTVNEVSGARFGVNLIPHSLTVTTWGAKTPGDLVNLEVDVFARYVARLMEFRT